MSSLSDVSVLIPPFRRKKPAVEPSWVDKCPGTWCFLICVACREDGLRSERA